MKKVSIGVLGKKRKKYRRPQFLFVFVSKKLSDRNWEAHAGNFFHQSTPNVNMHLNRWMSHQYCHCKIISPTAAEKKICSWHNFRTSLISKFLIWFLSRLRTHSKEGTWKALWTKTPAWINDFCPEQEVWKSMHLCAADCLKPNHKVPLSLCSSYQNKFLLSLYIDHQVLF